MDPADRPGGGVRPDRDRAGPDRYRVPGRDLRGNPAVARLPFDRGPEAHRAGVYGANDRGRGARAHVILA